MAFEKFSGRNNVSKGETVVHIEENGDIVFNPPANAQVVKGVRHVHLYYDREAQAIGIQNCATNNPSSFLMSKRQNGRIVISASSFVRHFDIPVSPRARWDLTSYKGNFETDMLVLKLSESRPYPKRNVGRPRLAEDAK